MELKTFRASSPAAALKKAQEVCGEDAMVVSTKQLRKKTLTQDAIYEIDRNTPRRKSHENEMVLKLYEEYLGTPYGEKAHDLLHTCYTPGERI